MVRASRISKALVRAASRLPSTHRMDLRTTSAIDTKKKVSIAKDITTGRTRAKPDLRKTKMGAIVKPKPNSCWLDIGDEGTISIPTFRLLNELPVRVREKVEAAQDCCARFVRVIDGEPPRFDIPSLRKHQLFSKDHADHLDPEIIQWLPRVVCPGCVLNAQCQDGTGRGEAMLRHIKTCKGFQAHFPDEHGKLYPISGNQMSPLERGYRVLKMTFGQLEFLRSELSQKRKSKKGKPAKMTAAKVEEILASWHPIVEPGVEEICSPDFPPVSMPRYFTTTTTTVAEDRKDELKCDEEVDEELAPTSSISFRILPPVVTQVMHCPEEAKMELEYEEPELYLPPHLLPPTTDPAILAAAMAAHAPAPEPPIDLGLLFEEFILYPEEDPEVGQPGDPVPTMPPLAWGGDANDHSENPPLYSMLQNTFSQSLALFNQFFTSS